jgi:hypothetical protein
MTGAQKEIGKVKLTPAERMKADRERSTAFVARDRERARTEALAELSERRGREAKREAPVRLNAVGDIVEEPEEANPLSEAMNVLLLAALDAKTAEEFLATPTQDSRPFSVLLEEIFGVTGEALAFILFAQGGQLAPRHNLRAYVQAIAGLQPKSAMQGMLSAQMVAVHFAAMTALTGGSLDDQRVNRVTKLLGLFSRQVELLARLQGRISQQKIIVERVDIGQGGQAAIGVITGGAPGGHQ